MNAQDRVALILGRTIMRAEHLADELAAAKQRIAELEQPTGQESVPAELGRPA